MDELLLMKPICVKKQKTDFSDYICLTEIGTIGICKQLYDYIIQNESFKLDETDCI